MERLENLKPVVKRLLGLITPVGDSTIDETRLLNLKDTTMIADYLIEEIISVAKFKYDTRHSMKVCGEFADDFLTKLKERLEY